MKIHPLWQTLLVPSTVLGLASAVVAETPVNYSPIGQENNEVMGQVNNVAQLRDVNPGDWAYEALRSLVERYNCIVGYPDRTFRGNRPLTRYEFAAGLNSCLQQIERLIATQPVETIRREDLDTLQRLILEFQSELSALGTRVDNLENRLALLEGNQFSTTTQLEGEVVFGLTSLFGGDIEGDRVDDTTVFGHRTRIELLTSFTGEDLLFTRLKTGNFPDLTETTGISEGALAFAEPDDNQLDVEVLLYSFPISDRTQIILGATGVAADDFADTLNILDGDGGSGALSAFGTRNPIYYLVEGAGVTLQHSFGEQLELSLGYLASEANNPSPGAGLFQGPYGALAQLTYRPSEQFNIGFTYINSYNQPDTGTGGRLANFFSFVEAEFDEEVDTSSNSYGVQLSWRLSPRFVLGGWAGYTKTRALSVFDGSLDIWNWAVTLGFPDLGREGNLGGIIVGMEPKVTNSTIAGLNADSDTSLHIEAFYEHRLNDNIALTPGFIWLTAPNHNRNNDSLFLGVLRGTFTF